MIQKHLRSEVDRRMDVLRFVQNQRADVADLVEGRLPISFDTEAKNAIQIVIIFYGRF